MWSVFIYFSRRRVYSHGYHICGSTFTWLVLINGMLFTCLLLSFTKWFYNSVFCHVVGIVTLYAVGITNYISCWFMWLYKWIVFYMRGPRVIQPLGDESSSLNMFKNYESFPNLRKSPGTVPAPLVTAYLPRCESWLLLIIYRKHTNITVKRRFRSGFQIESLGNHWYADLV